MTFVHVPYDARKRQAGVKAEELARHPESGAAYVIMDFTAEDFLPSRFEEKETAGSQHKGQDSQPEPVLF